MGFTYVNPQAYYDAAKKLTDIGTGIDAATTTLVQALWETGSMAGTSDAATKWAISYDTRASDAVTSARKLAQTLPYFATMTWLTTRPTSSPHAPHPPNPPWSPHPVPWIGRPPPPPADPATVSVPCTP